VEKRGGEDEVVRAFGDALLTYYEERRLREAGEWTGGGPPESLAKARAYAGTRLIAALDKVGVGVTEDAARRGLRGLAPLVQRHVHTRTEGAFATLVAADPLPAGRAGAPAGDGGANAFPGSFLVAAGVDRDAGRTLDLPPDAMVRYHLVAYDRTLVEPYDAFVARRRGAPFPVATRIAGDAIYLDRGAIRAIGERFLASAPHYRSLETRVRSGATLALAEVKDLFRARSLEGVASLDDFVARYGAEEERHAAALLAMQARGPEPAAAEARALLTLAATKDLDPRGPIATALGLHVKGLAAGTRVVAALRSVLATSTDGNLAHRLTEASLDDLRTAAAQALTRL
jgi:hypothetical protein